MTEQGDTHVKRKMPKGVRKGGTRFPRQTLGDSLAWAKKLVAKTHLGPQPEGVVLSGVVGNSNSVGRVRLSTLKQFGLMEGDSKGYIASDLAKRIEAAPTEERSALYRAAVLAPPVFKALFDTFHGDEVTHAKLKQRAAELKVHPEETGKCADVYVTSMVTAGLATLDGDKIAHLSAIDMGTPPPSPLITEQGDTDEPKVADDDGEGPEDETQPEAPNPKRAIFNVNVTLDSSLDTEKLERQLRLLKKFGAI
ncbi:hypothetical protein [Brevundimonas nasdae]|uniref:DUF5343 domain-containing protein n=1 Tax=Brevundimonas nasdae TaxID=172043 RepID=A0ABX8TMT5_9CAUL|nr:hypothetical protein [Brevundimonas nasdae]QYC11680.1 hypothetical protein KWG56_06895 [Brevundimonas nasdae]QYC14466.1 hypothetical protein KWG63_02230 [Brevundimonas nasdae]